MSLLHLTTCSVWYGPPGTSDCTCGSTTPLPAPPIPPASDEVRRCPECHQREGLSHRLRCSRNLDSAMNRGAAIHAQIEQYLRERGGNSVCDCRTASDLYPDSTLHDPGCMLLRVIARGGLTRPDLLAKAKRASVEAERIGVKLAHCLKCGERVQEKDWPKAIHQGTLTISLTQQIIRGQEHATVSGRYCVDCAPIVKDLLMEQLNIEVTWMDLLPPGAHPLGGRCEQCGIVGGEHAVDCIGGAHP